MATSKITVRNTNSNVFVLRWDIVIFVQNQKGIMLSFARKLFLFLLFIPHLLFSINNDSVKIVKKNTTTQFFNSNQFEYADSSAYIDLGLDNFQNYFPKNSIGNSGLPFNDLFYHPFANDIGFNYAKNNYANYFYSPQNLKFYNTRTPYTDLFYVAGTKLEQIFKMTFSYNVKKNWNITADFSRFRSSGFYTFYQLSNTNTSQSVLDNFVAVSSNYKSNNNRYCFLASVIYNNAKNNESGGIKSDTAFQNGETTNPQYTSVVTNLDSAKRQTINRSVFFKQYLNLGSASTDTAKHNAIIPNSRFILTTLFEDNTLKYQDAKPLSGYYPKVYYDTLLTFDSTYHFKIENELLWKRVDNGKHRGLKDMIGISLGLKDQLVSIQQHVKDTTSHNTYNSITFNNIFAEAEFYNTYSENKIWWNVAGKYGLTGYNARDYNAAVVLKKNIKDNSNVLILKAETKQQAPDFIFTHYLSNNFIWNNNFEKMQQQSVAFNFSMKKFNFEVGSDFSIYSNVLYFDNSAIARQSLSSIPIVSAFLKKNFSFYNFHLNNKIIYQKVPDLTVIRLPEFVLEHSLYYENDIFKHAMRIQIGASVFYTSAYYSNAYMPATGEFYLQNQQKYGNYPFVDFFLNVRVQTVRVFIKIDHLNSGYSGANYIMTPHYPVNERSFKIGVSWKFFD